MLKRRQSLLPTPKIARMSLDGQDVTGFEKGPLLGKGGYGRVFEAVCTIGTANVSVACKEVSPPATLLALRDSFRAGCVLAVRCDADDADSLHNRLESQGLVQADGDEPSYWLCKVVATRPKGYLVQWLEHTPADGGDSDSLTMQLGQFAEITRRSIVSVVRGSADALKPSDTGIQFSAAAHAAVTRDMRRADRLEVALEDAARELALSTKLRSSLCPFLMTCRGGVVSEDADTVLILMSRMECDLYKRIKSEPLGMPEKDVQLYAASMLCALEELHRLHVVHGDVKPQNALLSDGGRVLRLGDFGLATTVDDCNDMELQFAGTVVSCSLVCLSSVSS